MAPKAPKKSEATKTKTKKQEPDNEELTTIEFLWSRAVSEARERLKYQLQYPFEGRMPPIPGVKDPSVDAWIDGLVSNYSIVLHERRCKKLQQLWAAYDPKREMVRNFNSLAFFKKPSSLSGTSAEKMEETASAALENEAKDQERKTKEDQERKTKEDQEHKTKEDQRRKTKDEHERSKTKEERKTSASVSNDEKQAEYEKYFPNLYIPCLNIFPELRLSQSMVSLISLRRETAEQENALPAEEQTKKSGKAKIKKAKKEAK